MGNNKTTMNEINFSIEISEAMKILN